MKYYLTKYQSNIREQPLGKILGVSHPNTFLYSISNLVEYSDIIWAFGFIYDMNGFWHEGYVALSRGEFVYMDEFTPHVQVGTPYRTTTYITQLFGERPNFYKKNFPNINLAFHNGVDFVGVDKKIYTIAPGLAEIGYEKNGYGNFVKVSGATLVTIYAHLSKVVISNNTYIDQDVLIGFEGNSGGELYNMGQHLHLDIRSNMVYNQPKGALGRIDPLPYLNWENIIFPNYVNNLNNYN